MMMISTTDDIAGFKTVRTFGVVDAFTCNAVGAVGNLMGGLQALTTGGKLDAYVGLHESTRKEALDKMCEAAGRMGANAVLGVRIQTQERRTRAGENQNQKRETKRTKSRERKMLVVLQMLVVLLLAIVGAASACISGQYRIQEGDTFYSIATRFSGVIGGYAGNVEALVCQWLNANPGVDPCNLQIGQCINVPAYSVPAACSYIPSCGGAAPSAGTGPSRTRSQSVR